MASKQHVMFWACITCAVATDSDLVAAMFGVLALLAYINIPKDQP